MENGIPVLVLFGPTASGKTSLLEELFTGPRPLCRAELISADSMQVYRGMDIGTAKPDKALREKLPHHLIDIRNPSEQFNAGDFVRLADEACETIARRPARQSKAPQPGWGTPAGQAILPVISGGTGFYLKNFIMGLPEAPPSDPALREELKKELAQKGPAALLDELARLDPVSAERIHVNDTYRLLRALEVCRSSGLPLSSFAAGKTRRAAYRFAIAEIRWPREELYRRIDARCEEMFRQGLAEELASLFAQGYTPEDPGLRAIGYREFFVENGDSLESAPTGPSPGAVAGTSPGKPPGRWALSRDIEGVKALISRNSRRYAKRQETFFSGMIAGMDTDIRERMYAALPGPDHQKTLDLLSSLIHTLLNDNP